MSLPAERPGIQLVVEIITPKDMGERPINNPSLKTSNLSSVSATKDGEKCTPGTTEEALQEAQQNLLADNLFKFKESPCWTKLQLTHLGTRARQRRYELHADRLPTFQQGLNIKIREFDAERFAAGGFFIENCQMICFCCDLRIPLANFCFGSDQCPFDIHAKFMDGHSCAFHEIFKTADANGDIVKQCQTLQVDDQTAGAKAAGNHPRTFYLVPCQHVVQINATEFWDQLCRKQTHSVDNDGDNSSCPCCAKPIKFLKQVPPNK